MRQRTANIGDYVTMGFDEETSGAGTSVKTTLGLLPVIAISAALTSPVLAQEQGVTELDVITVEGGTGSDPRTSLKVERASSNKVTAPLLDTPRTVQVITQRQMEERGASSLADVLRTTPGVTLGTGEGGNPMGDRPFIRGYEASTDTFVDGIRSLGRTSYEAFNLESIEIIKGPGGAYAGRGSTGGSLNMVTKKARLGEDFHEFSGLIGTDSQYRGSYDGNFSVGDNFAARLNLNWQDSEVPGRGGIEDDKFGAAGSFVGQISEATKLTLGLYHNKSESTPDFGIPMANAAFNSRFSTTQFGTGTKQDPWRPVGIADHGQFYGSFLRDFREVTNQAVNLSLDHEFSDTLRLNSTLAYLGNEQKYVVTRPTIQATGPETGWLDRSSRQGYRDTRTLAWATSLSGEANTGAIEHSYVVGFEMSDERQRTGAVSNVPSVGRDPNVLNPNPWAPISGGPVTFGPLQESVRTKTKSVFVFDTLKFNEQWSLNLGARYENFDVEQGTRTRDDNIFSYQAGIVYKPLPNGSIYASFGTSANPSGQCAGQAGGSEGASACTLTAANEDLKPEKNRSYEIGTKWDLFDDRLSVTAALFRTEKTNQRVNDAFGNVELLGSSRAQGIELGVAGNITDQWSISAGYTYTDAKLTDAGFDNIGTSAAPVWVPSADAGNKLHYIAPHSFAVWTTYDVTEKWRVGGGATYTSKRFMNSANTAVLPSQWRVDLMTAYQFNDKAGIQLNVNNVFDEKLYDASHVGLFANVQAGRNATVKFNYKF